MRKNLTVSLAEEDWKRVRDMARRLGGTYSDVFHRLINAGFGSTVNEARVTKWRAVLAPDAEYRAKRAALWAKAGRRR